MGFTVVHKGGTKDSDYQEYVRSLSPQLLKRGLPLDNLPRVPQDGREHFYLYVWDKKAEASAFAENLKKETRDPDWFVRAVRARPSQGPLRPLEIEVGRQGDGWVFGLETFSQMAIEAMFPNSCRHPSVFIGTENRGDFFAPQEELRDVAEHVLHLLTGLTPEQLRPFGWFRLVDPVTLEELLPPSPIDSDIAAPLWKGLSGSP